MAYGQYLSSKALFVRWSCEWYKMELRESVDVYLYTPRQAPVEPLGSKYRIIVAHHGLQVFYFANRYFLLFALIGMYVVFHLAIAHGAYRPGQSCRVERDERGQLPGVIHLQSGLRQRIHWPCEYQPISSNVSLSSCILVAAHIVGTNGKAVVERECPGRERCPKGNCVR